MLMSFDLLEKALKKKKTCRRKPTRSAVEKAAIRKGSQGGTGSGLQCIKIAFSEVGWRESSTEQRGRETSVQHTRPEHGCRERCRPLLSSHHFSPMETTALRSSMLFLSVCVSVCFLVLYCHAMREWLRSEQPGKNVCDGSSVRKILDKSDRACEELRRERSCGREVPSPPQCFEALEMEETQWRVLSCGNNRLSLQSRESSPTKTQQWVQLKPMGSENVWIINIWQGRGWDSV